MNKNIENGQICVATSALKDVFNYVASFGYDKVKLLSSRIHQTEILAHPATVQDLLCTPDKCNTTDGTLIFTYKYTYGNVKFQNGLDGKTIRWFVDGVEMPSFICESEDQYGIIGQGLKEVAEQYYNPNSAWA